MAKRPVPAGVLPTLTYKTKWQRDLRAEVFRRAGEQCQNCGWRRGDPAPPRRRDGAFVLRTLEVDHITPRAKGGTHDIGNLQLLCSHCNASKCAR